MLIRGFVDKVKEFFNFKWGWEYTTIRMINPENRDESGKIIIDGFFPSAKVLAFENLYESLWIHIVEIQRSPKKHHPGLCVFARKSGERLSGEEGGFIQSIRHNDIVWHFYKQ